ncbi:type I glutamate--ammonia ligase [Anoxybacter fermentans]|uniref:glutamine synthetase n=1 Tax=Anoxybacter fermentans TaxID=1323375 RepID=A0A3Q9HNL9_9FIRM|nr:type I glutamate--ammonia ligase [Anoxybacter fermentans]AZR72134.1 type I glutamate--ammonia ligase [Anoxybacter fermentans]
MFKSYDELQRYCQENQIQMIDFRMIALTGEIKHLTIPVSRLSPKIFEEGIGFDGSNYGYTKVEKSDMVFIPDITSAFKDPFWDVPTLSMIGDVFAISETKEPFEHDPRYIAKKAEDYLKESGIADANMISPEFEFYVFDNIAYQYEAHDIKLKLDAENAYWRRGNELYPNLGYQNRKHGGYHAAPPLDTLHNLRSEMVIELEKAGIQVKYHHHEVGGPGQLEIELEFDTPRQMADTSLLLKYILKNVAVRNGKTLTFMPKPIFGEAGNGMHVHMYLLKDGQNIFYDPEGYEGLSEIAFYYMGGILKHAKALMGFTNPSTNSYKRLVPGYEAPVSICFATSNRSSVIRIPGYVKDPAKKRFEFRPSDATCNPYLAFAALLMAGIDGIINKIDPRKEGYGPYNINIFELSPEERAKIGALPASLDEALDCLETDHEFLTRGGVMSESFIENWIAKKREEARAVNTRPHPYEFELYYSF